MTEEEGITLNFINKCDVSFNKNKRKRLAQNIVASCGSMPALSNVSSVGSVNHVFTHSLKPVNIKACDQGESGRCWEFAGLNMLRPIIMTALNIDNFEYSQVYLFFFDKLERINSCLQWIINNNVTESSDRRLQYVLQNLGDGGYWNTFSNLATKYGLVPKSKMPETCGSYYSYDMNRILTEIIRHATVELINTNKTHRKSGQAAFKKEILERVYDTLRTFLGTPPKSFEWFYENSEENQGYQLEKLTPLRFKEASTGNLNLNEFKTLMHNKHLKRNQLYELDCTEMMYGKGNTQILNVPIRTMIDLVKKSLLAGFPVWFACDIDKGFDYYNSALDEHLIDTELVFGEHNEVSDKDMHKHGLIQASHAMVFTGFNCDEDGKEITELQVENSWSYWDHEVRGLDGFLTMKVEWFVKYVVQIVIHRKFLTKKVLSGLETEPVLLDPWEGCAPAMHVSGRKRPKNYIETLKTRAKFQK